MDRCGDDTCGAQTLATFYYFIWTFWVSLKISACSGLLIIGVTGSAVCSGALLQYSVMFVYSAMVSTFTEASSLLVGLTDEQAPSCRPPCPLWWGNLCLETAIKQEAFHQVTGRRVTVG